MTNLPTLKIRSGPTLSSSSVIELNGQSISGLRRLQLNMGEEGVNLLTLSVVVGEVDIDSNTLNRLTAHVHSPT